MKLQLVILSVAVFVSAFALPVPDEEVSPIAQLAPVAEVKSDAIVKPEEIQPVEVAKPESRAAGEDQSSSNVEPAAKAPVVPKSAVEEKKLETPVAASANAPDSESAPILSDKKEEKKADKQIRIENNAAEEIKALPVVEIPAAGITEQKHTLEELKPAIEELNTEAKSAAIAETPASEQKKEELSAAEETPIVKSEISGTPLPAIAAAEQQQELKKEDLPARQERGGAEEKVEDAKVDSVKVAAGVEAVVPPVVAEVVPAVKSLSTEEKNEVKTEQAADEVAKPKENAEAPVADLKSADVVAVAASLPEKILGDVKQAAGDISQQSSEEASNIKALKPEQAIEETLPQAQAQAAPEAKKIEEANSAAAATTTATADEPKKEETKPAATEPLKKIDDKKSAESKESKESEESKESAESNEDKSN